MSVKAKVRCGQITETDNHKSAQLITVIDDSDDNKDFVKDEPAGSMQIMYDKTSKAAEELQQGETYIIEFTKVEK